MSERLDKNPFYRTLVKEFSDIYCELNSNEWILCVPTVTCLQGVNIDRSFIGLHILKPSLLLKWHYVPLLSDEVSDVEIDNMFITITRNNDESHKEVIRIVGEEIAYNCLNKQYKIYIVSSPFIKDFERITETPAHGFNKSLLITFTECQSYLNSLSTRITSDIEEKTNKLSNTYLILPTYLDDAAKRFQAVIDWGITRFDELHRETAEEDDEILVAVAVESFVIGLVHNKIFEAVKKKFAVEDQLFENNSIDLNKCNYTPLDFGAQEVFKTVELRKSIAEDLTNLDLKVTPLEKIHTLKKVVDSVNCALVEYIKNISSPFDSSTPKVAVVGDDLVACVVYLLCANRLKHMVSNMSFIQFFGGHLSQKNEFGYSLVTFEVAVEFIKRFDKKIDNDSSVSEEPREDNRNNREENKILFRDETNVTNVGSNVVSMRSKFDSQLENISQFLKNSIDAKESSELPKTKNDEDNDLGGFLSSLSRKHYVVGAGRQAK